MQLEVASRLAGMIPLCQHFTSYFSRGLSLRRLRLARATEFYRDLRLNICKFIFHKAFNVSISLAYMATYAYLPSEGQFLPNYPQTGNCRAARAFGNTRGLVREATFGD